MSIAAPAAGGRLSPVWIGLAAAALCGTSAAFFPPLAMPFLGAGLVLLAARQVERLAVLSFWTLPYMVANMPTGAFTLKLPELVAYLFAAAYFARAWARRERIEFPPATAVVLIYLAVLSISAALSPVIPDHFRGTVAETDRNSAGFRSASIVIWLLISWAVVIAAYNVIGRSRSLFRRCLRAHILGSGIACAVSVGIYVLTLGGLQVWNVAGLGIARNLAPIAGSVFRLAGVAYEPLFLAFYLVTVIPVTIAALLHYTDLVPRNLAAICLGLQGLALLLTFSTGGYVAIGAALLFLWPVIRAGQISRKTVGALAAAVLLLMLAATGFLARQENSLGLFGVALEKLVAGGDEIRRAENLTGLLIFEQYPVIGVGPGMAGYHFPRYHPYLQSQILSGGVPEVNSVYLGALAETGVVGLAALAFCALAGAAGLLRAARSAGPRRFPALWALLASLGGCAVHYAGLNPLFLIYFTGLLALAVSAARLVEIDGLREPS